MAFWSKSSMVARSLMISSHERPIFFKTNCCSEAPFSYCIVWRINKAVLRDTHLKSLVAHHRHHLCLSSSSIPPTSPDESIDWIAFVTVLLSSYLKLQTSNFKLQTSCWELTGVSGLRPPKLSSRWLEKLTDITSAADHLSVRSTLGRLQRTPDNY